MLKRIVALGMVLSLTAVFAVADDKPKHNMLTAKEVADGWILLFDGESTFGWRALNESKWTIADGMLAPQEGKQGLLITTAAFGDCEVQFDYIRRSEPDKVGQDDSPTLRIGCDGHGDTASAFARLELKYFRDSWTTMTATVKRGAIQQVSYAVGGQKFSESIGGADRAKSQRLVGFIALSGKGIVFRNIKIKPLDTKPLFNGKDLTGWKKYNGDDKRAKTEFTVTPEGWLHLKTGPGDLQTTDQYQDFILQAECYSNGKHLNSGIFFRCIPGQYQNGYEAQIHNGWTEKPDKEYIVEVYDPQTHKLKDKEKVKSAAMDYGTGAVYRRVPARKAVAKDNEWFTMTIAAQGRHIATWVDGVQVVDWTDNRPLDENPRNGCRLEKGAISLQGHDPTTDLSFRNIRIEELPSEKK